MLGNVVVALDGHVVANNDDLCVSDVGVEDDADGLIEGNDILLLLL